MFARFGRAALSAGKAAFTPEGTRTRGALLAAGIVALAVAAPGPAQAAYPGRAGLIAYVVGGDIYTVHPDGSHVLRIATDGAHPRWAPDGRSIAFDRGHDVWVMTATGAHAHQITHTGHAYQPTWSPNGSHVAFIEVPKGGHGDIYEQRVAGGRPVRLTRDGATTCGDTRPTWDPRGGFILFEQYTVGAGSTGCLAPFEDHHRIMLLDLTTGRESQVTADGAINPGDYVDAPDFTPDGSHVLALADCMDSNPADCAAYRFNPPINVIEMNLHGTGRTYLTDTSGVEGDAFYYPPAAAPDGQRGFVTSSTYPISCPRHPNRDCTEDALVWQYSGGSFAVGHVYPDSDAAGSLQPDWQPVS